jgi:hypothetical protein
MLNILDESLNSMWLIFWGQLNTDHVNILDESYNSMLLKFDANWLPTMWIFWMNFRILSDWYFEANENTYHVNILDES